MELMITIVIIAILATIAYPSYLDYTRNAKRAEAISGLLQLQLAQEEYRARNASYGNIADLNVSVNSDHYTFSAADLGASSYTLTATAVGNQQADTACPTLSIDQNDSKTPAECWR